MPDDRQYCSFRVEDLLLGVDVHEVQEVIRAQPMTTVPCAPPTVKGLINLRGEIVTAVDLRRRLGYGPRSSDEPPMNVVVRVGDEAVSLLVDEIDDIFEIADADHEPVPATVRPPTRDVVASTCKLPGQLLLVLDTARAVAVDSIPAQTGGTP